MSRRVASGITPKDLFLYAAGLGFLALAKAKHVLKGYSSPKPFSLAETDRSVAYDLKVVDEWLAHLERFTGRKDLVRQKRVLELGPGSDLGVGLYLLAKGAAAYNACDVNDLMSQVPESFYAALLDRVRAVEPAADVQSLASELREARAGKASRLRLVVREDFDLVAAFGAQSIDLVFSQAAFEHFDDVPATVARLSAVCKPGAVIVAVIDLKTHSRWIRDKDPNNIYRYSKWIYERFHFRGIPNRVRPHEYREIFARNGWTDISTVPLAELRDPAGTQAAANSRFKDPRNELTHLSVVLCARKT
jgi:SAM-dependent methyltransferase